jgi:sulfatase maturation enzyme AslB (radical SAM superfamily)
MIHAGLQINLKSDQNKILVNHCCLRSDVAPITDNFWASKTLTHLREKNKQGIWDQGCWTCQGNELAGLTSFRTGMLDKFGEDIDLSGPKRLDLMFDIGCNLACRTCGPKLSTYWQRHLKDNNIDFTAPRPESRVDDMITILKKLDLANLEMVVFCGGETLLGQGYWQVAEAIADMVPNAKERLTVSFQTNGTQTIREANYSIIERFHLVKLNISLDGIGERFNYLRWPANWQQVTQNINQLKETLPNNVMFLIEETVSIFNLYYQSELDNWVKINYATNRLGDAVDHTRHMAEGTFGLHSLSSEYVDMLANTNLQKLIHPTWVENPQAIKYMLAVINKFDRIRQQDWTTVFPEVAEFYKKFATTGI